MISRGCNKDCITAKIAGGASMFNFTDKRIVSDIGQRNIKATREDHKETCYTNNCRRCWW